MTDLGYGGSRDDFVRLRQTMTGRLKMLAENPSNPSLAQTPQLVSQLIEAIKDIDGVIRKFDVKPGRPKKEEAVLG